MRTALGAVTGDSGIALHVISITQKSSVADLVFFTGYGAHSLRYLHAMERLCKFARVNAHGWDYRGHGRSGGSRGVIGSADTLVFDAATVLAQIATMSSGARPLILLGHSLGSNVVILGLANGLFRADAAVMINPLIRPGVGLPAGAVTVLNAVSKIAPHFPVGAAAPERMSDDPDVIADFADDPFVLHGKVTAATAAVLVDSGGEALKQASELTLPALVMIGSKDRAADPESGQLLHEALGSAEKTLKIYPDLPHALLSGSGSELPLRDTSEWLSGHLSSRPARV